MQNRNMGGTPVTRVCQLRANLQRDVLSTIAQASSSVVPRPIRGPIAPGIYHVNRRSAGPIAMYRDDFDRTDFCKRLSRTIRKYGWKCHAFVLMTTHYHLLVEVDQDALQPGMHMLNSQYAQVFNRRWAREGT